MRNFLAAIARVLRSMRSTAWTWVQEGGRWVMKLIPGAAAPEVAGPSPEVQAEVADAMAERSTFLADEETFAVKRLALLMFAGIALRPEHLEGITDRELDWLRVLDQSMLHKISVADHQQIRAHMKGTAPIRGVVPYDPAAVANMKSAWAIPVPSSGRRTLREVLEAEGLHP